MAVCVIPTTAIRRPVDRDFPFGFEEFVKKKVCVNTWVFVGYTILTDTCRGSILR